MSGKMVCLAVAGLWVVFSSMASAGEVSCGYGAKEGASWRLDRASSMNVTRLDAPEKFFDFGAVRKGSGEVTHEFVLRNVGSQDLVIKNLRTSLASATVTLKTASEISPAFDFKGSGPQWKGTIKPGETAILELVLDLDEISDTEGPVTREVFFVTNDPAQFLMALKFSLEVTKF